MGGMDRNLPLLTSIPKPNPELLTASQMARRLRVQVRWLRDEAEAGRVPSLDVGNTFLFNEQAVTAALAERAKQFQQEEVGDGK